MSELKLWSDGKSLDEIEELDHSMAMYNLHEDIICLKEDLESYVSVDKIKVLIDRYFKRINDSYRPPFEQEAYALVFEDLKQLINPRIISNE